MSEAFINQHFMLLNCMCVTCVGKLNFVIFDCLVIHMRLFHQREQDM